MKTIPRNPLRGRGNEIDSDLLSVLRGTCHNIECAELQTLLHILDTIKDNLAQVNRELPAVLQ